jgi:hypothetical protein
MQGADDKQLHPLLWTDPKHSVAGLLEVPDNVSLIVSLLSVCLLSVPKVWKLEIQN